MSTKLLTPLLIAAVAVVAVPQAGAALLLLGAGWLVVTRSGNSARPSSRRPKGSQKQLGSPKQLGSFDAVLGLAGLIALLASPTLQRFLFADSFGAGAALLLLSGVIFMAIRPTVAGKVFALLGLAAFSLDYGLIASLGALAVLVLMLWFYGIRSGRTERT